MVATIKSLKKEERQSSLLCCTFILSDSLLKMYSLEEQRQLRSVPLTNMVRICYTLLYHSFYYGHSNYVRLTLFHILKVHSFPICHVSYTQIAAYIY